jgi:hypothetical protein
MSDDGWQKWFEGIWADREEKVYRAFFGDTGEGIYTLGMETFKALGCEGADPRFLTHGVFACPPNEKRDHWVYVTSGMSNAWGETPETVRKEGPSGLGYEFTLHAREKAMWPIKMLHWVMAVQLLVATGDLQGELLQQNDRVPLGGPIGKKEGLLTHLLVTSPEGESMLAGGRGAGYPGAFGLKSGNVELLLLVGITGKENDFAKAQGAEGLVTLLQHRGVWPVTDVGRVSLV